MNTKYPVCFPERKPFTKVHCSWGMVSTCNDSKFRSLSPQEIFTFEILWKHERRCPRIIVRTLSVCILMLVSAPGAPRFIPEDSSAENNTVTLAWQSHPGSVVDGYTLELDDGNEGDFRVSVY